VGKEILTYDDLLQIVELIKSAESFSEFHLKIGDIELDLRKSDSGAAAPPAANASIPPPADASAPAKLEPAPAGHVGSTRARAAVEVPPGAVAIKSPMVGTFYRSPEPGAKPFVEVGQRVGADTTVCIIEVMKLMNSIAAGCEGTVTHVLANDAEAVDVGQLLIIIDPTT
jgi:acetyl-CoA carboxylase biotin carboxyl carrier protein